MATLNGRFTKSSMLLPVMAAAEDRPEGTLATSFRLYSIKGRKLSEAATTLTENRAVPVLTIPCSPHPKQAIKSLRRCENTHIS